MSANQELKPWQIIVSSCSGALLTSLLMTPLDVVKIRMQAQRKPFERGQCFLYCNGLMDHICTCTPPPGVRPWYNQPGRFTGTFDALVKISRQDGVPALWSGLPPTLVMALPATVIYYCCYERFKYMLGYHSNENPNALLPPIAGATARFIAATIINPLELIRTKMQSKVLRYSEIAESVRIAVQHGGVLALWKGWAPSVLRDVPFSVIYWFHYELFKARLLQQYSSQKELTFPQSFACGACAGAISAVLTTPFDVVKTHRQIELGELESLGDHHRRLSSTWKIISRLYRTEGVTALFTGLSPRIIKVAPACAIMISSFEYGKRLFHAYNNDVELEAPS